MDGIIMHIIDADKLIEFIDIGIKHSSLNSMTEPINSNGEYDVVTDITRSLDRFTQKHLELVKNYVIENMI